MRINNDKGFTLVELLTVISIISLLLSILLPSLAKARLQGQTVVCMNNVRQLGFAFMLYGVENNGYSMPSTYSSIYWWGKKLNEGIDHKQGFVWPYLKSRLSNDSVFQCPSQPFGSYRLQGVPTGKKDESKWITSTYGYNGYYLCPSQSGWYGLNGPWQKITSISFPYMVLVFADTLIDLDKTGKQPNLKNTYSLDPPQIYNPSQGWIRNESPTTCFRHNDKANVFFADGHSQAKKSNGAAYASVKAKIGTIGQDNSPYYVPNYRQWPKNRE